jgi:hypothetical protein
MADDNDDSWLYGAGQDESMRQEEKEVEDEDASLVKNGNTENKTYDTFDEHNFEVNFIKTSIYPKTRSNIHFPGSR